MIPRRVVYVNLRRRAIQFAARGRQNLPQVQSNRRPRREFATPGVLGLNLREGELALHRPCGGIHTYPASGGQANSNPSLVARSPAPKGWPLLMEKCRLYASSSPTS